jgi:DNA-binding LacI/PurR family transcriptional regulator
MRPETLTRIQQAIEKLGYRRSWAARQLKTGFIPVLGLLVPSVANPFHGALARFVEEAALARGFQVVLGNSLRDPERERQYGEDFWGFGIRGLIAGSSPLDLQHFADLVKSGLRIVAFDRSVTTEPAELAIDSVSMDNRQAGYLATRHLIDLGHRRIGYISGITPTVSRRDRLQGYYQALSEMGIAVKESFVARGAPTLGSDDANASEHGRLAAHGLLGLDQGPTALVALNDMQALGACVAVRERGGLVPRDVSVVGIDDIVLASLVDPPLTTVRQPLAALSAAAVECLVQRLEGEQGPPHHRMFEPQLIVRGSSAAPKGKK